jgi:hypothetical protein
MPWIRSRVAIALGWFVVAWIAAYLVGQVFFGSANVLVAVIAVGAGVGAYLVLLVRDRRRAAGHHR